jgi:hypothetical protein
MMRIARGCSIFDGLPEKAAGVIPAGGSGYRSKPFLLITRFRCGSWALCNGKSLPVSSSECEWNSCPVEMHPDRFDPSTYAHGLNGMTDHGSGSLP